MEVIMPKMGESINEGTILKWHKKKGDFVKRDEIIFEISTDKVDTEVPSPAEGILSDIKVKEGDTVEVGSVVALIEDSGQAAAVPSEDTKDEALKEQRHEEEAPQEEKVVEERIEKTGGEEEVKSEETPPPASTGDAVEILMPKMGESVMEGTIIKWHKKSGDQVKKDEILFEISTDKVDTEIPSPAEGTLSEIMVKENETVEVGTVVAKLNSSGEVVRQQTETQVKEDKQDQEKKETAAEEISEPQSMHDNFTQTSTPQDKYERQNRFLSPLVMNIARQENVSFDELDRIKGTGLNERITKKDILSYIEQKKSTPMEEKKETPKAEPVEAEPPKEKSEETPAYKPAKSVPSSTADIERIPMDNIRQKIMQHMVVSRDTSVHVSAMLEVDMTKIYNFIQKNRDSYVQQGVKLTYMPFIAQAAVRALREYPLVNSSVEGTTILKKKFINLGIAVAVEPTGLIVPNIKNADEKNLVGLAKAISEIAAKARTKKLTPDDITNGTFTITNYGVFGTIFGTPILNQPEVAILGVGAVIKKAVVVEYEGSDTIAIKPIMALTISHDHRLIDGMLGGLFLKYIKDTLENFDPASV
jgi:pyruvate dehydrogenase E2 component (dihydrolipoamide acetyltransferase)